MGAQTGDEHGVGHGTPIQASYALGDDDGSIADARHLAAAFLERARTAHGLAVSARVMDLAQLVVSELVTNARKYAPGPTLMHLRIADGIVDVSVWDSDPTVPTARSADPGRIGQHGLEIVKAVASHLDVEREAVGKRITARLPLADTPRRGVTALQSP
ncbi:ATP-binding protein [Streptomyces fagopyri]|uniref:ATP-binding protein n=1 Tax=Streptomyces fagopyri TaxID=2662397 RepID=A0A5Q0L722_9ACTN|nr:ATP-binding protein [Streptomyces fagopyri]QFZ72496.1 ATP-binding protein [Streptomyces fagopyri]